MIITRQGKCVGKISSEEVLQIQIKVIGELQMGRGNIFVKNRKGRIISLQNGFH